jgi:hypothetical protein
VATLRTPRPLIGDRVAELVALVLLVTDIVGDAVADTDLELVGYGVRVRVAVKLTLDDGLADRLAVLDVDGDRDWEIVGVREAVRLTVALTEGVDDADGGERDGDGVMVRDGVEDTDGDGNV